MFTIDSLKDIPTALDRMKSMANELMNNSVLKVGQNEYRLTEIEFYLFKEAGFPDPYTHRNPLQLTSNHWYFHRSSKNHILKPVNRIGLDLTCGIESEQVFGGILIRGMMDINDETKYWFEPSKIVKKLVGSDEPSKEQLAEIEQYQAKNNPFIMLVDKELTVKKSVYECPRFGLKDKGETPFYMAPFRFITFGDRKHKEKEKTIFPYLKTTDHNIDLILKEFNRKTI